jgi:hypothetical protein
VNVSLSLPPIRISLSLPCGEQKDRIHEHEPQKTTIAILAALSATSLAFADEFKTNDGKEYKDATIFPEALTSGGTCLHVLWALLLRYGIGRSFHHDDEEGILVE